MTKHFASMIEEYKTFRTSSFPAVKKNFEKLADEGQAPKVLFISCCDSRVDPSLIFNAKPGDFFVIRNVASLVPPFEQGEGYHGVSAAVEFAVTSLNVTHIIVMGHTMCGGIRALVETVDENPQSFMGQWMKLGAEAKLLASEDACTDDHEKINLISRYATLTSLKNLRSFPWVQSREKAGNLFLHAWQFDIRTGDIVAYDPLKEKFQELSDYWQENLCGLDACKPGSVLQKQG